MTAATFARKARALLRDPVLRLWLRRRCMGQEHVPAGFAPHRPPYALRLLPLALEMPGADSIRSTDPGSPDKPWSLRLAGVAVPVAPGSAAELFERAFDDLESLLALHRFAWIAAGPLSALAQVWTAELWSCWCARFSEPDGGWAWHPYTAGERALNVARFARRHGVPGDRQRTLAILASHAPAIAERLEYFGEHETGNHLSNNGRCLYLLGLALGLSKARDLGASILVNEAKRILLSSGILREGSSHYHLLVTRNYAEAWLAARAHGRPEAAELERCVRSLLAAAKALVLPGGLPLIGDVSPDVAPSYLAALAGGDGGWLDALDEDRAQTFVTLRDSVKPADRDSMARDGWLRTVRGRWATMGYAAPTGWLPMPGHAHQDYGSFEAHFDGQPVIIDPGRGQYGETGAAAHYASGAAHNLLSIDGKDPYPPNKPYYNDGFRRQIVGKEPEARLDDSSFELRHCGFSRLAAVGVATRSLRHEGNRLILTDRVEGHGVVTIIRSFHTPLEVRRDQREIRLQSVKVDFVLEPAHHEVFVEPATRWIAYGEGTPATVVRIRAQVRLPWSETLELRPVGARR